MASKPLADWQYAGVSCGKHCSTRLDMGCEAVYYMGEDVPCQIIGQYIIGAEGSNAENQNNKQ